MVTAALALFFLSAMARPELVAQGSVDCNPRPGVEQRTDAQRLTSVGDDLRGRDDASAVRCYTSALAIWRTLGDRRREANALDERGDAYGRLRERRLAVESYTQAAEIWHVLGDREEEAGTLNNAGVAYYGLGDNQKAVVTLSKALELWRSLNHELGLITSLHVIGVSYSSLGDKEKALRCFEEALEVRRRVPDPGGEALILNSIGVLVAELGDAARAASYFEQARLLCHSPSARSLEAVVLANAAVVYDETGRRQRALNYGRRALRIQRSIHDQMWEARTLRILGEIHANLRQWPAAAWRLNQALAISRSVRDPRGEAKTLNSLGRLYDAMGARRKAFRHWNMALAAERHLGDPLLEALSLTGLGRHSARTAPNLAVGLLKQAINKYQEVRRSISGLDSDLRDAFRNKHADVYRELADLLIGLGRLAEAREVLDSLKEHEYNEFIRGDGATASTASVALTSEEEELRRAYRERAEPIAALAREYDDLVAREALSTGQKRRRLQLRAELEKHERDLREYLDGWAREAGPRTRATTNDVYDSLKGLQTALAELDGTVVVQTLVASDNYRVVLVTPSVIVAGTSRISAEKLNRLIMRLRQALLDSGSDPRPEAAQLYRVVLGPIEKELDAARPQTILWSLDGAMRYVPMAALYDGMHYMVERYRQSVFTPASIPHLLEPAGKPSRAVGLGMSKAKEGLGELPGVAEELRAIIRDESRPQDPGILPGHTFLDDDFTRDRLRLSLLERYPVVHIASHFVFRPGNDTDSFLLAGDGKITLAEIKDPEYKLAGVHLLTLSACNTAMVGGDGREIDSFAMLAQQKGARTVMATLWEASDQSTAAFMREFYALLESGSAMTKVEALRRAQIALLRGQALTATATHHPIAVLQSDAPAPAEWAHPYYWAPFILIGSAR